VGSQRVYEPGLPAGFKKGGSIRIVMHAPEGTKYPVDGSVPAEMIRSIRVPVLVAGGEKSPPGLQSAVREVARILTGNGSEILKGQTHNVSAKVLAPVLIEFFKN